MADIKNSPTAVGAAPSSAVLSGVAIQTAEYRAAAAAKYAAWSAAQNRQNNTQASQAKPQPPQPPHPPPHSQPPPPETKAPPAATSVFPPGTSTSSAPHAPHAPTSAAVSKSSAPHVPRAPSSGGAANISAPNLDAKDGQWIYVLLCAGGKYYVGETHNVEERFMQHLMGVSGAAWTKKYEPIEVVKRFVKTSVHDEDNTTLDYMAEHGIRNVRGGSFCMVHLPKHVRRTIKQRLATIKKLCYRCKKPGHCANNCPTAPPPSHSGPKQRSWIDYDSEEDESNHQAIQTNQTTAQSTEQSAANPLFTFDHGGGNSAGGAGGTDGGSVEGDEKVRPPLPQSEPERLIDPLPLLPSTTLAPRHPVGATAATVAVGGGRIGPLTARQMQGAGGAGAVQRPPVGAPLVCARCGRNNHQAVQCFAKHHLRGQLLPPR